MVILTTKKIAANKSFLKDCGGKAANLFLLKEAGFMVPDFLVIPSTVIDLQIQEIKEEINEQLKDIFDKSDEDIIKTAAEIEKILHKFHLTADFENEVMAGVSETFENGYMVSVRSSALQEDNQGYSFAGQFSSFMYVSKPDLMDKIKSCIASAFSARVLKYKVLNKINPLEFSIAVIIQRMVDAKISGIIFSRNVTGNLNEMLIEAGFGAGEGVVGNATETESLYIDRDTHTIRKISISEKFNLSEFTENKNAFNNDVLSKEQALQLFESVLKIENLQAFPQDVEFSIDHENNIYFLQARPITTFLPSQIKIIDNTNIVESYPGITLPLSFSFALEAYRHVFTGAMELFKVKGKQAAELHLPISELITHVQGRVYYNLHHWYKMVQTIVTSEESLGAWETLIGVNKKTKVVREISLQKKIHTTYITISLLLNYKKLVRKFFRNFNKEYAVMRNYADTMRSFNQNAKQIFNFYLEHSEKLFLNWAPTIMNDFFTFKMYDLLKKQMRSYGFKDEENIANDLLCGTPGVESEMPVICLLKLKEMVLHDNKLMGLFNHPGSQIISLLDSGGFTDFKIEFDDYIRKYGDRTLEELKLESFNLRMDREILVTMIKDQLQVGTTAEMIKDTQLKIRTEAEKKITAKQNKWSPKTWSFKLIRKFAERAVKNRENMRFARTRVYGVVKEYFLAIGERMAEDNLITEPRDIFYLTMADIRSYSIENNSIDRKVFVKEKKELFAAYDKIDLQDRIMYSGDIIPLPREKMKEMTGDKRSLTGISVSGGKIKAKAIVIKNPDMGMKINGEILVTRMTDPGWIFLMSRAGGLISEKGSLLSHTAIVGRELGIPTIVGVAGATTNINTNDMIEMDADKGIIKILDLQFANYDL